MSKYDEMSNAFRDAANEWSAERDRCWAYAAKMVNGFLKYCEIPQERVTFLRWNKEKERYAAGENGNRYNVIGAIDFDAKKDYWHFAMTIDFPVGKAGFAVHISEKDGKATVAVGADPPRQVNLDDSDQCREFYDSLVAIILRWINDPKQQAGKQIGFPIDG